jgi:type VI protein secretion system component VasK
MTDQKASKNSKNVVHMQQLVQQNFKIVEAFAKHSWGDDFKKLKGVIFILGIEQSGKSTLIKHADIAWQQPTQLLTACPHTLEKPTTSNWYFTDEYLLCEIPGIYVSENITRLEEEVWRSFLRAYQNSKLYACPKKFVYCVSIYKLLREEEQFKQVKSLQQCMLVLAGASQYTIDVFFTKIDMILGFNEYYVEFSEEQAQSAFGFYIPHTIRQYAEFFLQRVQPLLQNIHHKSTQTSSAIINKELLEQFPQQWTCLCALCAQFLNYWQTYCEQHQLPLLPLGIHWGSGKQVIARLDLINKQYELNLAAAEKPESVPKNRPYFIAGFFQRLLDEEKSRAALTKNGSKYFYIILLAFMSLLGILLYAFINSSLKKENLWIQFLVNVRHSDQLPITKPETPVTVHLTTTSATAPLPKQLSEESPLPQQAKQELLKQKFKKLEDAWSHQILAPYQQQIAPYFPFNSQASQSVPEVAFKKYFGPNGTVQKFIREELPLAQQLPEWAQQAGFSEEQTPHINPLALQTLLDAQAATEQFYQHSSKANEPVASFNIQALPSEQIQKPSIAVNGVPINQDGTMRWPLASEQAELTMGFTDPNGHQHQRSYRGGFVPYELLKKYGRINPRNNQHYYVTVYIDGYPVIFEVWGDVAWPLWNRQWPEHLIEWIQ